MQQKLLWLKHHQSGVFSEFGTKMRIFGGIIWYGPYRRKPLQVQHLLPKLQLLKHHKVLNLDLTRFVGWADSNWYHEIQHEHTLHTHCTSAQITGQNTTETKCWCGRLGQKAPQNMCSLLRSLVQCKKCIFPSCSKILFLKVLHSLEYHSLKFHSWRLLIL